MFLDRHQLDDIVSELLNPREGIGGKLLIGSDLVLGGTDTNMSLVDASRLRFFRPGILEDIFLRGVPENSVVDAAHGKFLRNTFDPSREAVEYLAARNLQHNLVDVRENTRNYPR